MPKISSAMILRNMEDWLGKPAGNVMLLDVFVVPKIGLGGPGSEFGVLAKAE